MTHVLEVISIWAIPLVVAAVALYAIFKRVPVYTSFTTGCEGGILHRSYDHPVSDSDALRNRYVPRFRCYGLALRYLGTADEPDRPSE